MKNKSPVFIHSFYRASSTYFCSVFEKGCRYVVYQEPENEAVRDLINNGENKTVNHLVLRHPLLKNGYYGSLIPLIPKIKNIYSNNFSYSDIFIYQEDFKNYLNVLIDVPNRPVIQMIKSAFRINGIKNDFGGIHVYLRRDPYSQFCSMLSQNYTFLPALMLMYSARNLPASLKVIANNLDIPFFDLSNLDLAFNNARQVRLKFLDAYYLFFGMWVEYNKILTDECDFIFDATDANYYSYYKNISNFKLKKLLNDWHFSIKDFNAGKYYLPYELAMKLSNKEREILEINGCGELIYLNKYRNTIISNNHDANPALILDSLLDYMSNVSNK